MIRRRWVRALAAVALAVVAGSGCGTSGTGRDDDTGQGLRIIVPNTPGSGYDVTARTAAKAMEEGDVARDIEVFNLPGAGGAVALRRLVNERGTPNLTMMMGLGVIGAVYTHRSTVTLGDTTPVARLMEEPGGLFVAASPPYATLGEVIAAWKADPRGLKVGGGSSPGGPDHLLVIQLANALGIDPKSVDYVAYDGGGELLPGILRGEVTFGISGYSEFLDQVRAGQLRMLAVTSEDRTTVLPQVPTLREQGVDTVFTNWRGVVAPPGIGDAERQRLLAAVDRLHDSGQWQAELHARGWTDAYLSGAQFAAYLQEQDRRVAGILTTLAPS
jgi:putative tricarboxylic transport membrane protein